MNFTRPGELICSHNNKRFYDSSDAPNLNAQSIENRRDFGIYYWAPISSYMLTINITKAAFGR
ncbi:MAG: hypothetical protein MI784_11265 [Cytophagales bacterium]|nr:hypothetical protein [Cytophagales bacterium]